jgi:beta-1,4-mannosyl-glycoprotein beta-1,4-N-acetylglucosaminyltransferase
MIVDCCTFAGEFELLELRLRTLDAAVDRFVLCEAAFTFRGDPKPLHLAGAAERLAPWRDRVTVLTYPGPPAADPWANEWGQRDYLATALAGCAPDDLVLIGDCDEIPDPRLAGRRPAAGGILVHRMLLAQGYVNRAAAAGAPVWGGTRAVAAADVARYGGLSEVRKYGGPALESVEGGWHFTSLGGPAVLERKMRAYSHAELDVPYFRDRRRLETEYAASGEVFGWVPLDERFPPALRDDPRWSPYVWAPPPGGSPPGAGHAHGCFAYVPADAPAVAVFADDPGPWSAAGGERFGAAFAGVHAGLGPLLARLRPGDWAVVDGLERRPRETLAALAGAGAGVVAYAANARSLEVFRRVLEGTGAFPAGRAAGRSEYEAAIRAAGFGVRSAERIFSRKLAVPLATLTVHDVVLDRFAFPELAPDAFNDFLSDAFVFALTPPQARA